MEQLQKKGKLIVIDGTDGSGKKTQTHLLLKRLEKERITAATVSFPQYGKKSAGLVEEYLNGKYGKPDTVSPYVASLFYALDRFDLSKEIRTHLGEGLHVITDRYVDANAGHQGGKIKNPKEREKFLEWLYQTEYELLQIPRPNFVIILHVPMEIGRELVQKKQERLYIEDGKKLDGHEDDPEHMKAAEASYLWLAEQFLEDHKVIECVEQGKLLTPEEIHEKIWELVRPLVTQEVEKTHG